MILWLQLALLAAQPSDMLAAPAVVKAPVKEVTVYSDRAKIVRGARVALVKGEQALRFPDLPGSTLPGTIRVATASDSSAAVVLRVETTAQERERIPIEEVDALLTEIESLVDAVNVVKMRRGAVERELRLLHRLEAKIPTQEARPGTVLSVFHSSWRVALGFVRERRVQGHAKMRALEQLKEQILEKLEDAQRKVKQYDRDQGGFTKRSLRVVAIVRTHTSGQAELALEYVVTGASWKPIYELHFAPEEKQVALKTAGIVTQATGEDWSRVAMRLSTAIPGAGIEMPELLTWTLGEDSELMPKPRALATTQVTPMVAPAAGLDVDMAERLARLEVLRGRAQTLLRLAEVDPRTIGAGEMTETSTKLDSDSRSGEVGGEGYFDFGAATVGGALTADNQRHDMRMQEIAAEDVDLLEADEQQSYSMPRAEPEAESMGASGVVSTVGRAFSSRPEPVMVKSFALRDGRSYRRPSFNDAMLPAVLAGGFDYVYVAPTPATVQSGGDGVRVPLASADYPVRLFYEATPSLAKTAFLRAEVDNRGEQPILAGKASVFVRGDFVAETTLATTGPGGAISLPLGADENIRISHSLVPQTVTEGVFSKEDVTVYTTTIEVANHKQDDITIQVFDQVPKSNHEDIDIELVATKPLTAVGPDAQGVFGWEVSMDAGGTKKITFSYRVTRPAKLRLQQQ